MNVRRLLVRSALAVAVLATAGLALDRIFPPNLERYQARSTEVVDATGRLLRAFTTEDGKWRLKTTVADVDLKDSSDYVATRKSRSEPAL